MYMTDPIIIQCPHCKEFVIIEQVNCAIFRHGSLRSTGTQINPHLPKNMCDKYIDLNLIYGCGKPFKIVLKDSSNNSINTYDAEICDYI